MAHDSSTNARERFHTTRWSLVARAGSPSLESRAALESLCASYWYPLYAFARRRGLDHHAAQDSVQGFLARVIEKRDLAAVDPARGRFRAFLSSAFAHFLSNEFDRARTLKRGGDRSRISIDDAEAERRWASEFAVDESPEKAFERQWARELIARALAALEAEWARAERAEIFARLRPFLVGEASEVRQSEIARDLGQTENAVRIALHRLRKRFGELIRIEVLDTLSNPDDVEREMGELFDALG